MNEKKMAYEMPKVEFIAFEAEDIITTSPSNSMDITLTIP